MVRRFGDLAFDPERRLLTRGNREELHLTPKAFDLLALLIEAAPRVVRKSELHERLWPGIFVSDAALAGLVKELRRTLPAEASTTYVRTSHGVGYAFCAPLEESKPTPATSAHWIVTKDRRIALVPGDNLIGRDPEAIVWLDAAGVSRRHARITVERHGAQIEDLGSKNGTVLRAERVTTSVPLRDGDTIRIGSITLIYRWSDAGMSTETGTDEG